MSHHTIQCMEIVGSNRAARQSLTAPGLDVWIDSRPIERQRGGGDIHYISSCGSGEVTRLVLADVSGHGAAVDRAAQNLRKLMRKYINTLDQSRFAIALNHEFSAVDGDRFATALLLTYFAPTDHLIVCNAGHCRPLWFSARRREWQVLAAESMAGCDSLRSSKARYHFHRISNLPLGILEPTDYAQFAIRLEPGDRVVLFTDGISESVDAAGNQLGEAGLLEIVRDCSAEDATALGEQIAAHLARRSANVAASDDASLVIIEHTATRPAKLSVGRSLRALSKMIGLSRV